MKSAQCYVIASVFVALASSADAAHINVLYNFNGLTASPGTFAFGPGGVMYGVASQGGSAGHGTIYSFDPKTGAFTVLYNFLGGADGALPVPGLVLDRDILYGATEGGGPSNAGTVFGFDTKTATEHVLHSFSGSDGYGPSFGPIFAGDGNLYGTAGGGLAVYDGVVYKVDIKTGDESVIHEFSGSDGMSPNALTLGPSGLLYGSTRYGGQGEYGTVFSLDTNTSALTSFNFSGDNNLYGPMYNVVFGNNGYLYGATVGGIVYACNLSSGAITIAYQFPGYQGYLLNGPLAIDTSGVVYGTTDVSEYDKRNKGSIFRFDPSTGTEAAIYTFTNLHVGENPTGLVMGKSGALYGTTLSGGPDYGGKGKPGYGSIFSIKP
jgi:uncharacterized repeat protein (TIGR03803 family)